MLDRLTGRTAQLNLLAQMDLSLTTHFQEVAWWLSQVAKIENS
jgi:hypothetical protein